MSETSQAFSLGAGAAIMSWVAGGVLALTVGCATAAEPSPSSVVNVPAADSARSFDAGDRSWADAGETVADAAERLSDAGSPRRRPPEARLALLDQREGFAAGARGGADGSLYVVTSLDDDGPGSLRAGAEADEPLWIVFDVEGTIALSSPIDVAPQKTIDGRGVRIDLVDHGLRIHGADDVIIANVQISDGVDDNGDALSVVGSDLIWIDHCTLRRFGDGLLDIKRAEEEQTMRITVSWTRFEDHDKVMLVGLQRQHAPFDAQIHVTIHHGFFNETGQRHPRLAQGWAHVYGTVFRRWEQYVAASTQGGELLLENNFFVPSASSRVIRTDLDGRPDGSNWPGAVRAEGNRTYGGLSVPEERPDRVRTPSYVYRLLPTTDAQYDLVTRGVGRALRDEL